VPPPLPPAARTITARFFAAALAGCPLGAAAASGPLRAAEAEPGISDNSFFIEEAYNQEKGVVQHIQSALWTFDRQGNDETSGFVYAFTQEWPLGGVRHQASYTLGYVDLWGDQPDAGGIVDVLLNYRYQLWEESDARPAFAPRFSLVLPTGDEEEGLSAGDPGFQINLPVSRRVGDRVHVHLNAGLTAFPNARRDLPDGGRSRSTDLLGTHLGFSAILLLQPRFNVLLEMLNSVVESIDDAGERQEEGLSLFSPGVRYAVNRKSGAQWVLGAALPIGLSSDENDVGFLAYLSIEHPF
jgi:hypothetical protein